MNYMYGASWNCSAGDCDIGGGGEGYTSLDAVGNDLDKMIAHCQKGSQEHIGRPYDVLQGEGAHELIGESCDVGDEIIAVIGELEEDEGQMHMAIVCVIFVGPSTFPTIV